MTPGPTIIKKCSACSKYIEQHTIASGNTFGAIYWTDGKRETPMMPDQPWLIMCPHCHAPLWIDELDELGEINVPGKGHGEFNGAIEYQIPSLNDYVTLINNGIVTSEKEHYVRLHAWWAGNDARRNNPREIRISSIEESNLTAFGNMLDESDANELLMKAEIMRELGRFEVAITMLARSVDRGLSQAVAIIKNLAEKGDPYVREMHFK